MSSLKITIIIPSLLSGGAEKQSVFLAKVLSLYYKVSFIVLKGNQVEAKFMDILKHSTVDIILLKGNLFKKSINIFLHLRKNHTDLIFSYLASGNFFNAVIGSISGVKYRLGGIRASELSSNKIAFERLFHNYFNTSTISNNFSAVDGLSKAGFRRDKFHVIHNAFDLKQAPILRERKMTINIISVGRFVTPKDYFTALLSIKNLLEQENIPPFVYNIVGYGVLESDIRYKVKELGLEKVVKLIIKPDNLEDYFKEADIYLSTSLFEGLSNSVMEALSFSLPVVATPVGDMEYLVKQDENGFLCEMKNPQDITSKLSVLIKDYELRKKMGLKSYEIIARNFSMGKFEKNYIEFINKLNN